MDTYVSLKLNIFLFNTTTIEDCNAHSSYNKLGLIKFRIINQYFYEIIEYLLLQNKQLDQLLDKEKIPSNHYPSHLAEVNESNNVYSTEDILNEKQIPLVKKGVQITPDVAQNILKHKLMKPIELQVQLNTNIQKDMLLEQFNLLLEKYPDLNQLYEASGNQRSFTQLVNTYILSPLIVQKLTVFSQQLPAEFEKTLFCTLLAIIIAFEAGLNKSQINSTYVAGLSHDLGLLHISPDIFTNKNITELEWRALQSHTVSGCILIENIDRDYRDVCTAVLEHHERCDGSGYPIGKKDQLSIIGQIIGMADTLQAIRINQFSKIGRNLRDAIPFIQMNPEIYPKQVYRAAFAVITKIPEHKAPINPFKNIDELAQHLTVRGEKLGNAALIIRVLLHMSSDLSLLKDGKTMLHIIEPFDKMVRQSGLVEAHIQIWLEHVKNTSDYNPLDDMCELELMQNELYWQLKKVRNSFATFLKEEPDAGSEDVMQHLNSIAIELDQAL